MSDQVNNNMTVSLDARGNVFVTVWDRSYVCVVPADEMDLAMERWAISHMIDYGYEEAEQ